MAMLNHSAWWPRKPKPISSNGTAKAFAAGDAMFKRTGVNANLKAAMKKALRADRTRDK